MSPQISASEMVQSLTGFEELAVEKTMGIDPYADGERKPMSVLRALVYVQKKREGLNDRAARDHAMGLPMSEVQGCFQDEADEDGTEETPVTATGEGSAPSD